MTLSELSSSDKHRDDVEAQFGGLFKPLWARAQAGDEAAYREALSIIAKRLRGFFARRLVFLSSSTLQARVPLARSNSVPLCPHPCRR